MPQSRTDGLDDGEEVAVFISLMKVKNMHPLNLLGHFPNGQWGLRWREGTPTTATAPVQLSPAARSSPGDGDGACRRDSLRAGRSVGDPGGTRLCSCVGGCLNRSPVTCANTWATVGDRALENSHAVLPAHSAATSQSCPPPELGWNFIS